MEPEDLGGSARILVVEDEATFAHQVEEVLEQLGYPVAAIVSSASEALSAAAVSDLVLLDFDLGGWMDSIQLGELLVERHAAPVIYMAAHSDPATLARITTVSSFGFLPRPFHAAKIKGAIEFALHSAQFQSRLRKKDQNAKAALDAFLHLQRASLYNRAIGERHRDLIRQLRQNLALTDFALRRVSSDLARLQYALHHDLPEPVRTVNLLCQLIERNVGTNCGADTAEALQAVMDSCSKIQAHLNELWLAHAPRA